MLLSSACHIKDCHNHHQTLERWVVGDELPGASSLLAEKIQGCKAVPLSGLESQYAAGRAINDWVVTVVIIRTPCLGLPVTGGQHHFWKLCYLKENLEASSLFIFEAATNERWKLHELTVSSR